MTEITGEFKQLFVYERGARLKMVANFSVIVGKTSA
jgi:hypothetical protein